MEARPLFVFARVGVWDLYCIPLVPTSVCMPVLDGLDNSSFIESLKSGSISPLNLFFFFKEFPCSDGDVLYLQWMEANTRRTNGYVLLHVN